MNPQQKLLGASALRTYDPSVGNVECDWPAALDLRAAAHTTNTALLVPFVTGLFDFTQVKAAIVEERQAMRKRNIACADSLQVAPIIEVPAAAFVLKAFLAQSDFVVVAIFSLLVVILPRISKGGGRAKGAFLLTAYVAYTIWLFASR